MLKRKRVETESERRARYAAKDVTDKLSLKPGHAVLVVGKADPTLVQKTRAKVGRPLIAGAEKADVILYWPQSADEITATLKKLKRAIVPNGGIWVISAKRVAHHHGHKGRQMPLDSSHAMMRKGTPYLPDAILIPLGLAAGLVDNKICSVSDTQTAMRFVIRRAER